MNNLLKLILIALSFVSLFGLPYKFAHASNTRLSVCDDCSFAQKKQAALNASGGLYFSNQYVIDLKNYDLKLFNVFVDLENSLVTAVEVNVPYNVQVNIDGFFNDLSSGRIAFANNPSLLSDVVNSVHNSSGTNQKLSDSSITSGSFTVASSGLNECPILPSGSIGMYDFLTTSSLRKSVFDQLNTYYPMIQGAFNWWNSFSAEAGLSVAGTVSVRGSFFSIPQQINFADGGSLEVVVNDSGTSFNVIQSSVYDCSGNRIPTDEAGFTGNFSFESINELQAFADYGAIWGIQVEVHVCRSGNYQTRCYRKSNGSFVCSLSRC